MWKYLELKVPIKYTKNNSCYKIDMLWYNFARRSKTIVEHLKYIYIYIYIYIEFEIRARRTSHKNKKNREEL